MNPHHAAVAARAGGRCEYCLLREQPFNVLFEVDHITPVSQDGTDDSQNLALACHSCNRFKAAATIGVDPETGTATRLFNPRGDVWADHFTLDLANWLIVGVSPVGRVTAAQLRFNGAKQVAARRLWFGVGLYP